MKLKIKPFNAEVKQMYKNHGHFHHGDAGLDVFIVSQQTISAGDTALIHLQIACEPDNEQPYLLMPRSSIAKTPLRLCNSIGLIDGGYRGEIMACCDNIRDQLYSVQRGQRLFQLVACDSSSITYSIKTDLNESSRGSGGFGSTGK